MGGFSFRSPTPARPPSSERIISETAPHASVRAALERTTAGPERSRSPTMSHDPLLDKFREVRALLTVFKNTLTTQKRFTLETAFLFSTEDRAFWVLQEEHERLKHSGITPAHRDRIMKLLTKKTARWSHLCELAKTGAPIDDALIAAEARRR
jgi:hypothetical protein